MVELNHQVQCVKLGVLKFDINGGGANQLYVGNNRAGLSSAQLERVFFENPAGLPNGDYSARVLTTGEVVPDELTPIEP